MLCMGDNWLLKLFVSKSLRRGMTSNLFRDVDNLRSDVKPLIESFEITRVSTAHNTASKNMFFGK